MKPNVLKGELAKYGITITQTAKAMGISVGAASDKVNRKTDFTLTEIRRLLALFRERGVDFTFEDLFPVA